MSSILRSYCRHKARATMEARGMTRVCHHDVGEYVNPVTGVVTQRRNDSYFSDHWEEYCHYQPGRKKMIADAVRTARKEYEEEKRR